MKKVLFLTGNKRKIREAKSVLGEFGIEFETRKLDIDEIQHGDPIAVTKAKAKAAYETVKEPIVVQDTSWSIPALNGFPGAYMKDVATWFTDDDWLQLMQRHEDKSVVIHEHVVYFDGGNEKHFTSSFSGNFIESSRGRGTLSIDRVVMLGDNTETLAEVQDRGSSSATAEGYAHWQQFAEWYCQQ